MARFPAQHYFQATNAPDAARLDRFVPGVRRQPAEADAVGVVDDPSEVFAVQFDGQLEAGLGELLVQPQRQLPRVGGRYFGG